MRRKEYAASLGLAGTGRGRMSREALAAIDKARSEGMVFDDDNTTPVVTQKSSDKTVKAKSDDGRVSTGMIGEARFYYPLETMFTGQEASGKKVTVSGRNVCRNTGYSMVGCGCGQIHQTISPNLEIISVTAK